MKVELNKNIRIRKECITMMLYAEYLDGQTENLELIAENNKLYKEDVAFRIEAYTLLRNITSNTLIKIKTQNRRNSTVINEYNGYIEELTNRSYFKFTSPDISDGKPSLITFSYLLSVEVLDRKSRIEKLY